jgi:hypothetical protein
MIVNMAASQGNNALCKLSVAEDLNNFNDQQNIKVLIVLPKLASRYSLSHFVIYYAVGGN